MKVIREKDWDIHFYNKVPNLVVRSPLTEEEKKDPTLRECRGTRAFYYTASHIYGAIKNHDERFSEFAWVPRMELNQFFDKTEYEKFVHILHLY